MIAVLAVVAASSAKQLRRTATRGDVDVYLHGASLALAGEDVYARPEPRGQQYYLYLPLLALLFIPLTWIPFPAAVVFWTALNASLAWWIVVACFRGMTGRPFSSLPERARWIVGGAAILLTLRAILYHLALGQANLVVMAVAVLGLTWLAAGRSFVAGLAIGMAPILKIILLPLVIPFVAQGRGRVVAGIACGAVAGLLAPALYFGFDLNLSYVSHWLQDVVLSVDDLRATRHWPLTMNYSLAAQLYRFFGGVVAFEHDGRLYSVTIIRLSDPVLQVAGRLVPVAMALVIGLYAWMYRRRHPLVSLWGSAAMAFCLGPLFSLLSHKHYWVMLLPAHVYVVYLWYVLRLRDRVFGTLVASSFTVAMLSTTLFGGLGALVSNLGGLVWGAMLLAAAIFRAAGRHEVRDDRLRGLTQ